jgi:xylulokinase
MEGEVGRKTGISEYELMDREAEKVEPGSGGVFIIPHFVGRGMDLGVPRTGVIFGLTWTTRREQIIRAAMEGWAYDMRRGLEGSGVAEKGLKIEEVRSVGGGGRSRVWRQIKADVLGMPFSRINIDELGCFGVAILAGVGVGLFEDAVSPSEWIVKVVERSEPRDEYRERYDDLFKTYLRLNAALEQAEIYGQHTDVLEKHKLI